MFVLNLDLNKNSFDQYQENYTDAFLKNLTKPNFCGCST